MSEVLFDATDLAEMRAFNEANLPHSCVIQSKSSTDSGGGEYEDTWTDVATEACRLSPAAAAQENLTSGAVREVRDFYVVFAQDTATALSDRRLVVTHDIPGLVSPVTLDVTGTLARTYEMERKVTASLVGGL